MSVTPSPSDYVIPRLKADTIKSLLRKGSRLTGRKVDEYREIELKLNYVPNADGSAYVKLGNTQVLVGVKLEVGSPYPDAPDKGTMVVSAEFVPTASPVFEPGPPDENAIELARVIDRSLRELGAIDLSKLVLIPGKKVWTVWIDIYVLDHDGNLIDASALATLASLLTAKVPKAEVSEEGTVTIRKGDYVGPLPVVSKVVTVTLGKVGDVIIVDPDADEESILDTKLVVAVSDDGRIAGLQKTGMGALTVKESLDMIELAIKKGQELIKTIVDEVSKFLEEEGEEEEEEKEKVEVTEAEVREESEVGSEEEIVEGAETLSEEERLNSEKNLT